MNYSGYSIELPNGKVWGVAGGTGWTMIRTIKYDTPHVLIPIDEIGDMSPEEIGNNVVALQEEARSCQAKDYTEIFLGDDPGFAYLVDHIQPVSLQGKTEIDNLQILCKKCNLNKGVQVIDFRPNKERL